MPHIDQETTGEWFFRDTSRRLEKMEELAIEFSTHTATEELKFDAIRNDIKDMREEVGESLKNLTEQVTRLAQVTTSHASEIAAVTAIHRQEADRVKTGKRLVYWFLGLLATGALAKWGEDLYTWLKTFRITHT
jgi:hypothetical protein